MEDDLNGKGPKLEIGLKLKTTSKYWKRNISAKTASILTHEGRIWGKLRGNFECGSGQPSLFVDFCNNFQWMLTKQTYMSWKMTSISLKMEDDLNFFLPMPHTGWKFCNIKQ